MLSDAEKKIGNEMSKVTEQFNFINGHYFIKWLIYRGSLAYPTYLYGLYMNLHMHFGVGETQNNFIIER